VKSLEAQGVDYVFGIPGAKIDKVFDTLLVCTYQGAGVLPRELFDGFGGRIGLFHNQPADQLLDAADVVVAVGYNPVEYEPSLWNKGRTRHLVHIDAV
jgi:acetolactate synthase-1/2/3 large subunit